MGLSIRNSWDNPQENVWIVVTSLFAVIAISLLVLLAVGVLKPKKGLSYFTWVLAAVSLVMTFVGIYVIYTFYRY